VSNQRPIFNENAGLFGKANRVVMNGIMDTVDTVNQYQAALMAAQQLLLEQRQTMRFFLAKLNTATSLASYRWTYSGVPVILNGSTQTFVAVNDSSDQFSGALNLREVFNQTNPVDGMNPTDPDVSVGPVGSTYSGCNVWTTANLEAIVIVYVTVSTSGSVLYFFDRPNPIRCFEDCFGGGE
jgi:hypothetical protein